MYSYTKLTSTSALALLVAQSAAADVTPAQVWADFTGYIEGYGYEVSATETGSDDALTVSDIILTIPIPEEQTTITMGMPEMTFTADGGAVDVAWPASMPVTFSVDAEGKAVVVTLLYETTDLAMTVSGDPGDTRWDYGATTSRVSLSDVVADGQSIPPEVARGEIVMDGISGSSAMTTAEMREVSQEIAIETLRYDISARDPDTPANTLVMKGGLDGVSYSGAGVLPLEIDAEDPMALLAAMNVEGAMTYTGGSTQFNFVESGEAVSFSSASTGGQFDMVLSPQVWSYDVGVTGYEMQVQGGDIPFPVTMSAAEMGAHFTVPVAKSDAPQDMAVGLNLTDFVMTDIIWGMIDPGGQLPRDPATVKFDVSGKVRMLYDLFDPEQAEQMAMSDMPAELHSVSLNELVVDAVGAVLTGFGSFTFDNSDLQSFGGLPRPQGELEAELSGANALIDKLIGMGLVPEEQAMGARMMMGMFSVATGDDQVKSNIEINEQGHILANGQRIQ
ncbi:MULTISPECIES: DUF2125 domain-containing protein [unclassified Marinovum]